MTERLRREDGMTITEVTVVLAMLLVVLSAFLTVVDAVNRGVVTQQERSEMNDQARLAIEQIDREVRSGNVLYDPAEEMPATDRGYVFRIYTQANAPTRTPSFTCVQWRIEGSELLRRSWPPGRPEDVSDWRMIADNIVNRELNTPAFALDDAALLNGRTVDVTLLTDVDTDDDGSDPVRLQTSLTGRNTSFGFGQDACAPAPAG